MKNKLSIMGFIGLLGVMGLLTNNPGFYGFFGFFGFFGFANVIPDEMFKIHVNKAAKNAFFTGLTVYPVITIAGHFLSTPVAYSYGFIIMATIQILVFSISLTVYENNDGGK